MVISQSGVFAPSSELNILEGVIYVAGALTVNGELNSIGPLSKGLRSSSGSVNITGTMNIQSPSEPFTLHEITLHIFPSGTLTIEEGETEGIFQNLILNEGLIQKTAGTGTFMMGTNFENNGGTIDILSGSIAFNGGGNLFTNGIYNVNSDGFLRIGEGPSQNTLSGTLTGQLDGPFIINSLTKLTNIAENYLKFSGPAGVLWRHGSLSAASAPGAVLVNTGLIEVTAGNGGTLAQIAVGSTLRNEGQIVFNNTVTSFSVTQSSTFDNALEGVITVNDGLTFSGVQSNFLNKGLIQKLVGDGTVHFNQLTNEDTGIILLDAGTTTFSSLYNGTGLITGDGIFANTNANFTYTETFAPGNNGPGTLTYLNQSSYKSTQDVVYQLELNGTTPDTEHDVFIIDANAEINGTLDVIMGFDGNINDEFVIITANNITTCNLPAQVTSIYNGNEYTYDVVCNPDNVTLRVSNVVLGLNDNQLARTLIYPNPTSGSINLELGNTYPEIQTTITNILGQVITNERFANTDTINLIIDGGPGIYFVNVNTSKGSQRTFKIIKK